MGEVGRKPGDSVGLMPARLDDCSCESKRGQVSEKQPQDVGASPEGWSPSKACAFAMAVPHTWNALDSDL